MALFSKRTHRILKILFIKGSYESLARLESKIRTCLFFDGSLLEKYSVHSNVLILLVLTILSFDITFIQIKQKRCPIIFLILCTQMIVEHKHVEKKGWPNQALPFKPFFSICLGRQAVTCSVSPQKAFHKLFFFQHVFVLLSYGHKIYNILVWLVLNCNLIDLNFCYKCFFLHFRCF